MFASCHNCCSTPAAMRGHNAATIAVIGNPNTGKTTLFNALTGLRQHTGNYPGVTVEKVVGRLMLPPSGQCCNHERFADLIDLPGTYSLAACSPDEMIVSDVLLGQQPGESRPDAVLIVADASRLERNLFLVTQVVECGLPTVLALNMMDVAESAGLKIDTDALADELGCQVVPIVATRSKGLAELRAAMAEAISPNPKTEGDTLRAARAVALPPAVEQAVGELVAHLDECREQVGRPVHRVEALRVLLDRQSPAEQRLADAVRNGFNDRLRDLRDRLLAEGIDLDLVEPATRYDHIAGLIKRCTRHEAAGGPSLADKIDHVLLHPVLGAILFLAAMAAMFQVIYFGAAPMISAIDELFAWFGELAGEHLGGGVLSDLVSDGLIAGVGSVLVFLPQVLLLFVIIALLEDCGYMARAAVVMDRLLSWCGLSGRSFVPMLSCFACAVPGIMATRVIESRRDRIVTILVSPLMSCSARLPIYVLLIAAFIPDQRVLGGVIGLQGLTLFGLYFLGVAVAVPMAAVFKRTLLRGRTPAFVMEVPGFRRPSVRLVGTRVLHHGRDFLVRAGTIILAVAVIVWALSYWPRPTHVTERYDQQRAEARSQLEGEELDDALAELDDAEKSELVTHSFLGRAGHAIEPAVRPLGWDWRIGTAVLASFPAREVVVSTLGTLYNVADTESDGGSARLQAAIREHTRADGSPAMTPLVAVSLLVFMALCCQCAATLVVIRRETGSWRWPIVTFAYMTVLAYLAALLIYQVGSSGLLG